MSGPGLKVISSDLRTHPSCPHGPTLLFSRVVHGEQKRFFACSACRNRKQCRFFLWESDRATYNQAQWDSEIKQFCEGVDHIKSFRVYNELLALPRNERFYCQDCGRFCNKDEKRKHKMHKHSEKVSDHAMQEPTIFLQPLANSKKEAQYLFSVKAVRAIVDIIKHQKFTKVLCICAPRIHEYIKKNCSNKMSSYLLDIDRRFLSFFGPLEFSWYNVFNNHFFIKGDEQNVRDFLSGKEKIVVVTDPPFGGRIEPLADTFKQLTRVYQVLNDTHDALPIMWMFPYFNEPHIVNHMDNFTMLDFKVDYDNHAVFSEGPKGRNLGSPVRIFTNIDPSLIELPAKEGYRHCEKCRRWVANENKHCARCNSCTSKDGRTYVHCNLCKRCVKPTYKHCERCKRCAIVDHDCNGFPNKKENGDSIKDPDVIETVDDENCDDGFPKEEKEKSNLVDHEEPQPKRRKRQKTVN